MNTATQPANIKNLWGFCLIAACGGFLFGYDWVVIGGAKPFYEAHFNITDPAQSGWAMSSALLGCILGAMVVGSLSDKYGRKIPLFITAVLFIICAWGTAVASNYEMFIAFRILGGFAIGLASALSPVYIAEVSPASQRGRFVAINQLTIVLGVLSAQLINLLIAQPVTSQATLAEIANSWNGQFGWRYMFGAGIVPALIFFLCLFFIPESPRWLVKAGKLERAQKTLNKIGDHAYSQQTLEEIKQSLSSEHRKVSFSALLHGDVKPVLFIGIVLAIFQQWCGINVIFNYAQEIFASAGFDINDTLKSIVATGVINLLFTLVALPLVDKIGRRRLMLLGAGGLTLIYALIALAYSQNIMGLPVLILVLMAISIYAMTLAPVTWVLLSEIFPNKVRGMAMSVATFALWSACFALTYTFPFLNASLGAAGSFALYGIICLMGLLFIYRHVPETKGRTLEQLELEFKLRHST
ncbi:MAG: sugar porter family MFS transporter [Enterobacteriaceae bacterium]